MEGWFIESIGEKVHFCAEIKIGVERCLPLMMMDMFVHSKLSTWRMGGI